VPLARYTSFRIGGPADAFYRAESADELAAAVAVARELGVPWFLLGLGANVLVGDRGFRGFVIRNAARHFRFHRDGRLWAESGAIMQELILEAVERGWSGIEHYIGIPSTVGGAIWQNLHFLSPAPERERTMFIAEVFAACDILSEEGERRTVGADYVQFGYDDSVFHHRRDVVLSATFQLARGDVDRMHRILHENLSWRGARHPWTQIHPSAGSIFKKIEGVGAGRPDRPGGAQGAPPRRRADLAAAREHHREPGLGHGEGRARADRAGAAGGEGAVGVCDRAGDRLYRGVLTDGRVARRGGAPGLPTTLAVQRGASLQSAHRRRVQRPRTRPSAPTTPIGSRTRSNGASASGLASTLRSSAKAGPAPGTVSTTLVGSAPRSVTS
jgi:UDP-N-acetylmuramate dehydrogenase